VVLKHDGVCRLCNALKHNEGLPGLALGTHLHGNVPGEHAAMRVQDGVENDSIEPSSMTGLAEADQEA